MNPTSILSSEHRVIEVVLGALEKMAIQSELTNRLDPMRANQAVEFLKNFADKCHHGKEENHLFSKMVDRGFPKSSGPIGVMLWEHDQGRALIRAMSDAIKEFQLEQKEAVGHFIYAARQYVDLLRQHIMKEDHHLFPMAESVFNEDDKAALIERFEEVEKMELGAEQHGMWHKLAQELAAFYQIEPRDHPVPMGLSCCH